MTSSPPVRSTAIELLGVSKEYLKVEDRPTLLGALTGIHRGRPKRLLALSDVNLSIGKGETLGVIGRNGTGKSTLLRLMAGVTQPTRGVVRVFGRVAPLISVGVGFNREMTGRENVITNAMLLGLSRAEARDRMAAIVDFAELEGFLDTPVKFYSSGMFMRLGFSVAVHTDPDILLVDEVLAVGDLAFQIKCMEKMGELQASGTTVVIVSHSMQALRVLCPRCIVLAGARVDFDGDTQQAIARHHELMARATSQSVGVGAGAETGGEALQSDNQVVLSPARVDAGSGEGAYLKPGTSAVLRFEARALADVASPSFTMAVFGEDGRVVLAYSTPLGRSYRDLAAGETVEVEIAFDVRIGGGSYRIDLGVTTMDGRQVIGTRPAAAMIFVESRPWTAGPVDLNPETRVNGISLVENRNFMLDKEMDAL